MTEPKNNRPIHSDGTLFGPSAEAFVQSLRRFTVDDQIEPPHCSHLEQIRAVRPSNLTGCEDCMKAGYRWVHLRVCLTCGYVGCCDSSIHKHASKHVQASGHQLVKSFEPGEVWLWCYADKELMVPVD
jgi:uncharacterized UBP type Zn finger protein